LNTIERRPQTAYFWYEGEMRKCNHNVITKGFAPRIQGYRICSVCKQLIWLPVTDEPYLTNGKYDEEKIKEFAERDDVPYFPAMPDWRKK